MVTPVALGVLGDVGESLGAQEVDGGFDGRWKSSRDNGDLDGTCVVSWERAQRRGEAVVGEGAGVNASGQVVELNPRSAELLVEPVEQ